MATEDRDDRGQRKRSAGVRLLPPKPRKPTRAGSAGSADPEAQRWARELNGSKGRRLWWWLGNALLLLVLVGGPLLRGVLRALESERAYAELAACLYGGEATTPSAAGEIRGEREHLAAELVRRQRGWLPRCLSKLSSVAPAQALFVLPSLKSAEARVREAAGMLRTELSAVASYEPGQAMPERPLRAMRLLRSTLATQLSEAGLGANPALPAVHIEPAHALAAPARIPIYAAADAVLSLAGNDNMLRVVALDSTGLSSIEVEPGKLLVRARLVRSRLLYGFLALKDRSWLLWRTPASRCNERLDGCHAKTTGIALAPTPLVSLPDARQLAGHLAGRPDRSIADLDDRLLVAVASATSQVGIREFALPPGFLAGAEVPALTAQASWPGSVNEALILSTSAGPVVLGTSTEQERSRLLSLSPTETSELSVLPAAGRAWITASTCGQGVGFAFGTDRNIQLGELVQDERGATRLRTWQALPLSLRNVVHERDRGRDQVAHVCLAQGALAIVRDATGKLLAIACASDAPTCRAAPLAAAVSDFAVASTPDGALIAYSGGAEAPQILVRSIDAKALAVGKLVVPGACWTSKQGLCGRPHLARLGSRLLLAAFERTDLVALESADEGETWSAVPVL